MKKKKGNLESKTQIFKNNFQNTSQQYNPLLLVIRSFEYLTVICSLSYVLIRSYVSLLKMLVLHLPWSLTFFLKCLSLLP